MTRPMLCRMWHRPDKLGIIIDLRAAKDNTDCFSVWEVREGAADEPAVMEFLERLAEKKLVIIRRYKSSKRRIMGPAYLLADLRIEERN